MARWHVTLDPDEGPVVHVDGVEVPGVRTVAVRADAAGGAGLLVEVAGPGEVDGTGPVALVDAPDPEQVLADLLRSVDPLEVQRRALAALQWQDGTEPGAQVRAYLNAAAEVLTDAS